MTDERWKLIGIGALIGLIVIGILCAGCSTATAVLDILTPPDPVPVCDATSVGVHVNGQTCVKYDDGSYRWVRSSSSATRTVRSPWPTWPR